MFVGRFVKSFCADPRFSSINALSALCTPWAEARTSTQQKCPRVHCMGGRKVLSLFWWCPKKVKRHKWRMNIMLESSDKKDIFKHKKNHTCPACRAQSALSHSNSVFCSSTQKQANVWDEVTTGPPQIGRQKAKKSFKTYLDGAAGQTELKGKWWELMNLTEYTACLRAHGYTAQ